MSNKITREVIIWEELPKDWQVKKLKHVSLVQLSNVDKHTVDGQRAVLLCNYVDVYKNEKITSAISFMQATATDEQISRLLIQKNDVLFTKDSETPEDIGVPALVDEDLEGVVCGYHLAMARPDTKLVFGNYLLRVLQSEPIKKYFFIKAAGMTRYGLDKQSISEVPIPLPSLKEQQSIANYLDRELARIDSLISAKERLLELLAEKRRAVITHAVTRGLNADVSLRDSGVEWLGEVPGHWEVRRLGYVASLKSGENITADEITENNDFPVYGGNGLRGFTGSYTHDGYYVLIGRQGALCGNINYANGKFWASEHAVVVTPTVLLDTFWLGEVLRVMNLNQYSVSAAQPGLAVDRIKKLQIPFPPVAEQKKIAEFIDDSTKSIDRLFEATQKTIYLLQERRASLIAAVVSGKIKVQ